MQPLEHKTPSLSILDKKDENILRVRRQAWPSTPITTTHQHPSHDRNSLPQKTLEPTKVEKKKRAKAPVKRKFKVRVIAEPMPMNPTPSTEPNHTVVNTMMTTQMPVAKSTATVPKPMPVTVYNLAQGKFEGIPYPTGKLQEEEGPPTPSCNTPQERQQPEVAAPQNREDTSWPNTMSASTNLFDVRASWPIPPTEAPTIVKTEQAEKRTPPRLATIPHTLVLNKPQSNKPTAPSTLNPLPRQKTKKTGMARGKTTSRGTTTPKVPGTLQHMTFQRGFLSN